MFVKRPCRRVGADCQPSFPAYDILRTCDQNRLNDFLVPNGPSPHGEERAFERRPEAAVRPSERSSDFHDIRCRSVFTSLQLNDGTHSLNFVEVFVEELEEEHLEGTRINGRPRRPPPFPKRLSDVRRPLKAPCKTSTATRRIP